MYTEVTLAFPLYIPQGIPPSKRFAPLAKPGSTSINATKSQKPKAKVPARTVSSQPMKNRALSKQCVAATKQVHIHTHVHVHVLCLASSVVYHVQVSNKKQDNCDSLDQLQSKMKVLVSTYIHVHVYVHVHVHIQYVY